MNALRAAFSRATRAAPRLPARSKELEELIYPRRKPGDPVVFGEAWTAAQLRLKSDDDLHKLWFVLLKERNALLAEDAEARTLNLNMEYPTRKRLVRKSMARIKVVFAERSRARKEREQAYQAQQESEQQESENVEKKDADQS